MQGIILTRTSQFTKELLRHAEMTTDAEPDIWFDARDFVDMQQEWFDAGDELPPALCASDKTEECQVPLSEDFRRCFSQLSRILGDVMQSEMLSLALGKLLPGLPINIFTAAQSLYISIVERRDIDIAVLHALGFASTYLPNDINVISHLASFIRHTVTGYTESWRPDPLSVDDDSSLTGTLFTILALSAVAARHWMNDANVPQRGLLRVPGFMANLLIRTRCYWGALDNMARSLRAASWKPGFMIDTQVEITHTPADSGSGTNGFISTFSTNSTACPAFYTKFAADNRQWAAPPQGKRLAVSAHIAAMAWLKRESGISILHNCHTLKTQTSQRQSGKVVTHTHFNTRCDATVYAPTFTGENRLVASPAGLTATTRREPRSVLPPVISTPGRATGSGRDDVNPSPGILEYAEQLFIQFDPLKFPAAEALLPGKQNTLIFNETYPVENNQHKHRFHLPETFGRVNEKIILFFRRDNILQENNASREQLISTVAGYLFASDSANIPGHVTETELLAREILDAAGLYGGLKQDVISKVQAEYVVRHWIFINVLGMSPDEYIASHIAAQEYPARFDVKDVHILLSPQQLHENNLLNMNKIPEERRKDFISMWLSFLKKEMPFLRYESHDFNLTSLGDFDLASLYTGSRILDGIGLKNYLKQDAIFIGEKMWEMASSEGVNEDQIHLFCAPSLFFLAMFTPEAINQNRHIRSISLKAIDRYAQYRMTTGELHKDIKLRYKNYQTAVSQWFSKERLAGNIVSQCGENGIPQYPDIEQTDRIEFRSGKDPKYYAIQSYLNGWAKPCHNAPDNLNNEYLRLTSNVAEQFYQIDTILVHCALSALPENEKKFFSSPSASMHAVNFSMKSFMDSRDVHGLPFHDDIRVFMKNTDLIAIKGGDEERIYALKRTYDDSNGAYRFFRVDRDITKYINNDLLSYKRFGGGYKVQGDRIYAYGARFIYSIASEAKELVEGKDKEKKLVGYISSIHRNHLYDALFQSGNDRSDLQRIWQVVKNFIPFYDCIEGILDKDALKAIPSCLIDAFTFMSVFIKAASMSARFAIGVVGGLRQGATIAGKYSLKSGMRSGLSVISLPTTAELSALSLKALKALDPGIDILTGLSKKYIDKLIIRLSDDERTSYLARKITVSKEFTQIPSFSAGIPKMALLPFSRLKVPIMDSGIINGKNTYVLFNPDTGQAFGKRYLLADDRLIPFDQSQDKLVYDKHNDCYYRLRRGASLTKSCFGRTDADGTVHSESVYLTSLREDQSIKNELERIVDTVRLKKKPTAEELQRSIDTLEYLSQERTYSPALEDFTEAGNDGINQYLRYGRGDYSSQVVALKNEYEKLKDYEGFSYRIMTIPTTRIESLDAGDIVADRGFASSSANFDNAKEWLADRYIRKSRRSKYMVIIYSKEIRKKIAGTSLLTDHILIAPGERLKICGKSEIDDITYLGVSSYQGPDFPTDIFTGEVVS